VPLEKAMRQQRTTIRKIAWIDGTRISQCIRFRTSLLSKTGSEQLTRREILVRKLVLLFPKDANRHRCRWKKPDGERFSQAMNGRFL
jgi:hypothetical protein